MKAADIPDITLKEYAAANSLRLLYAPQHSNPLVCIQLYIRTGSIHENSIQRGYAHFLEHLVFKSTSKFPQNEISSQATKIGAVLNAYTDFDTTCFYLVLPSENLEQGLEILAEMAFHANFSRNDVNTEKGIIIEEIHQYEAEPEMNFIEYIQYHHFEDSPLKYPVLGNEDSIRKATREDLQDFYKEHYNPANAFMVVTGDFCETQLKSYYHNYFDAWNKGNISDNRAISNLPQSFKMNHYKRKGRTLLAIALPELNESHPDSEALHIAIRHLAIGKSSVLHKKLVERDRICSSVKVSSMSGLLPGASVILFTPSRKENLLQIVNAFAVEWAQITQHGVPPEDFRLIQQDIIHNWLYSFDGVENLANLIAAEEFNGDLSRITNFGSYIQSISNEHLIQAVRKHWHPDSMSIFTQGKDSLPQALYQIIDSMRKIKTEPVLAKPAASVSEHRIDQYQKPKASSINANSYYSFVLANNLKVIYNYQPEREICGFALSSPLSQLNERKKGINYFASAMLLYGTRFRNHDEIQRFSREQGFNIRVLHHLDSTLFRGRCHKSNLEDVLKLLSEILNYPSFDQRYLHMLKNSAAENLRRERDYPVSVAYKAWFNQLFGKNNNLFSSTGSIGDINAIRLADCEDWYETWSLNEDFALCIIGSLEPSEVETLANQYFSLKRNKSRIPAPSLQYYQTQARTVRRYNKLDQSIIHIGGNGASASSIKENSAFHVLAHILGGDLSSRLYTILREKYAYAYQTGFDFSSIWDLGYWYAYAFCDSAQQVLCLRELRNILDEIADKGISSVELESARNYLISISRMDNESVSYKASSIANLTSLGYDLDYYLQREQRILNTSRDTINKLARDYLNPNNRQINILV
jgi:zinc protease